MMSVTKTAILMERIDNFQKPVRKFKKLYYLMRNYKNIKIK